MINSRKILTKIKKFEVHIGNYIRAVNVYRIKKEWGKDYAN